MSRASVFRHWLPIPDKASAALAPAASGTLEDCQKVVEPGPLPDISGMTLIDES